MSNLNRLTLCLNAAYLPINVCPARRALTLMFKSAAVMEEASAYTVKTSQREYPIPSVIRMTTYRHTPRLNRSVSRRGILTRDGNVCQYCAKKMLPGQLTLDHVVPRSKGGQSTWENLVASCKSCNHRKGDLTPSEAGLVLIKTPRQLSVHSKHKLLRADQSSWDKYLFA